MMGLSNGLRVAIAPGGTMHLVPVLDSYQDNVGPNKQTDAGTFSDPHAQTIRRVSG